MLAIRKDNLVKKDDILRGNNKNKRCFCWYDLQLLLQVFNPNLHNWVVKVTYMVAIRKDNFVKKDDISQGNDLSKSCSPDPDKFKTTFEFSMQLPVLEKWRFSFFSSCLIMRFYKCYWQIRISVGFPNTFSIPFFRLGPNVDWFLLFFSMVSCTCKGIQEPIGVKPSRAP